jgi:hypothetical protein
MSWAGLMVAFLVCHLAGDFLVQTDWQALHKARGLGQNPTARRALLSHVTTYTATFIPAIVWLAHGTSAARVPIAVVLIAIPHALVDDGRYVVWHMRRIKGIVDAAPGALALGVDQTLHVVSLAGAAVALTA